MSSIQDIDQTLASVCKGEDKKNDALMLMSPDNNWDQFLTPAPCAIALLGNLMLIAGADSDFSLEERPPKDGFKFLHYPNSFRASLVQVSNAGWSAFNEAHTSMDQIYLHSGNVDGHVKNAVRFLMQGSPEEIKLMLPMSLEKIQKIADESVRLSSAIEERFVGVMQLTGELLEACTNTKGVYDVKKKETEIAIQVAKTQEELRKQQIKESKERLKKIEKDIGEAQSEFKEAIQNIPSGSDLLFMSAGEAMIEGIRNITSLPSLIKAWGHKKRGSSKNHESASYDNRETGEVYDEASRSREISRQRIYREVASINKHICTLFDIATGDKSRQNRPCPDWKRIANGEIAYILKSLETSVDSISTQTDGGDLQTRVIQICYDGIDVCDLLTRISTSIEMDDRERLIKDTMKMAKEVRNQSRALDAEASQSLGKNPLDNKSPHLAKMPVKSSSESIVKSAVENARYKTELAKATLKDARRREDETVDELKESNEKLTQVLMDMARLDLQNIDFDTIRETLVKGIKALSEVREQWGKMVRFFQMLSNLIKCCLHTSLTDFVDNAKSGRQIRMGDTSVPLSSCFRDVIFEQALKASQVAYVVRAISGTYVQISNDHLMDRITCLGRLVALDPKRDGVEISRKKEELHYGCQEAQNAIQYEITRQKEEFNRRVDERIARIEEMERRLPAVEPEKIQEIQEAISTGMNFSKEEIDDLV